jgi:hypothetical protein
MTAQTHHQPIDQGERVVPQWIDRLVELYVLAEHGDDASAREAQRWIATDQQARRVWEHVDHVCGQLHR